MNEVRCEYSNTKKQHSAGSTTGLVVYPFCVLAVSVQPPVSTYLKHPVNQSDASVTALHLTSLSLPHFESLMVSSLT